MKKPKIALMIVGLLLLVSGFFLVGSFVYAQMNPIHMLALFPGSYGDSAQFGSVGDITSIPVGSSITFAVTNINQGALQPTGISYNWLLDGVAQGDMGASYTISGASVGSHTVACGITLIGNEFMPTDTIICSGSFTVFNPVTPSPTPILVATPTPIGGTPTPYHTPTPHPTPTPILYVPPNDPTQQTLLAVLGLLLAGLGSASIFVGYKYF